MKTDSLTRVGKLVWITINSYKNKFLQNLGKELVILLCSTVLLALFYYIFNDFINHKLTEIKPELRNQWAYWFGQGIMYAAAIFSGKSIYNWKNSNNNPTKSLLRLGEDPQILLIFQIAMYAILIIFPYSLASFIVFSRFHSEHSLLMMIQMFSIMIVLTLLFAIDFKVIRFKGKKQGIAHESHKSKSYTILKSPSSNKSYILYIWRLKQLLFRNKTSQFCLLFSLLFLILFVMTPIKHFAIAFLFCLICGLYTSFAVSFQVAHDLRYDLLEKNAGVSHNEYLSAVLKLSFTFGSVISIMCLFCVFINLMIHAQVQLSYIDYIKAWFITFSPCFLFPFVIFQIDPRKPLVQIIILIISSIFLTTAIYASILTLFLLPFIAYYGRDSQKDRFYRA